MVAMRVYQVLDELQTLQASLPTFNDNDAVRLMEKEMNRSIDQVFTELTASPVAAASIGQVRRVQTRLETYTPLAPEARV
jgi:predicted unusual protein kinase regulating ubiquinone biosynthesis (AarF/ABC1/UbiB family)